MSNAPLLSDAPQLTQAQLKQIVDNASNGQTFQLPDHLQTPSRFLEALGIKEQKNGLKTQDEASWNAHKKAFGLNRVTNRFRQHVGFNLMPLFYTFLFIIVLQQILVDMFVYEYQFWYLQGLAMYLILFITMYIFSCGRNYQGKINQRRAEDRETEFNEKNNLVSVTRDGIMIQLPAQEMTVGDRFDIMQGERIPCDCIITEFASSPFQVDERIICGEKRIIAKQTYINQQGLVQLDSKRVIFADSIVTSGSARAIAIAVADFSTAATTSQTLDVMFQKDSGHDLESEHSKVFKILVLALLLTCTFILVHFTFTLENSWTKSISITALVLVYGFPYILAIPAIWDIALGSSAKNYDANHIEVKNLDIIEKVSSLDYLACQSISIFDNIDNPTKLKEYKRAVKGLQASGVKVVLVTGICEDEARKIALETGILHKSHENICGAVISGEQLTSIVNGQTPENKYIMTPEYLSVVYQAGMDQRATLVSFLAKVHPISKGNDSLFWNGFESFKTAKPVASIGVLASGRNDVKMMIKSDVCFCTSDKSDVDAKDVADMLLMKDDMNEVVNAIVRGRAFKDRFMQFLMLQVPSSIAAIALSLAQVLIYDEITVTTSYIFLINLVYFPIIISTLVREDPKSRRYEMIERWRETSQHYGTKTIADYMRGEMLKFTIVSVAVFQILILTCLYYYADGLFEMDWHHGCQDIFVSQKWINDHPDLEDVQLKDLTDKGKLHFILIQTFAFLQLFNVLNARRPSFKDLNPVAGITFCTTWRLVFLIAIQFGLAYFPLILSYGTISVITNLLCMALGVCGVLWLVLCKALIRFIIGVENGSKQQA